jgi:hypothetical protein
VRVTLDTTPPWYILEEPLEDVICVEGDVAVRGYTEAGARVFVQDREVQVEFGQFETHVHAPEGPSRVTVVFMDKAGNEAVAIVDLTVDTRPPQVELRSPLDGLVTNSTSVTVEGSIASTSDDLASHILTVNGDPWTFDPIDGKFQGDLVLGEGVNLLVLRVTDPAGNVQEIVRRVTVDTAPPFLELRLEGVHINPEWNEPVVIGDWVYITGYTEVGTTPSVNGVQFKVDDETGFFNYTLRLPEPSGGGESALVIIRVVSMDAAGNTVLRELRVYRLADEGTGMGPFEAGEWMVLAASLAVLIVALRASVSIRRGLSRNSSPEDDGTLTEVRIREVQREETVGEDGRVHEEEGPEVLTDPDPEGGSTEDALSAEGDQEVD